MLKITSFHLICKYLMKNSSINHAEARKLSLQKALGVLQYMLIVNHCVQCHFQNLQKTKPSKIAELRWQLESIFLPIPYHILITTIFVMAILKTYENNCNFNAMNTCTISLGTVKQFWTMIPALTNIMVKTWLTSLRNCALDWKIIPANILKSKWPYTKWSVRGLQWSEWYCIIH